MLKSHLQHSHSTERSFHFLPVMQQDSQNFAMFSTPQINNTKPIRLIARTHIWPRQRQLLDGWWPYHDFTLLWFYTCNISSKLCDFAARRRLSFANIKNASPVRFIKTRRDRSLIEEWFRHLYKSSWHKILA